MPSSGPPTGGPLAGCQQGGFRQRRRITRFCCKASTLALQQNAGLSAGASLSVSLCVKFRRDRGAGRGGERGRQQGEDQAAQSRKGRGARGAGESLGEGGARVDTQVQERDYFLVAGGQVIVRRQRQRLFAVTSGRSEDGCTWQASVTAEALHVLSRQSVDRIPVTHPLPNSLTPPAQHTYKTPNIGHG